MKQQLEGPDNGEMEERGKKKRKRGHCNLPSLPSSPFDSGVFTVRPSLPHSPSLQEEHTYRLLPVGSSLDLHIPLPFLPRRLVNDTCPCLWTLPGQTSPCAPPHAFPLVFVPGVLPPRKNWELPHSLPFPFTLGQTNPTWPFPELPTEPAPNSLTLPPSQTGMPHLIMGIAFIGRQTWTFMFGKDLPGRQTLGQGAGDTPPLAGGCQVEGTWALCQVGTSHSAPGGGFFPLPLLPPLDLGWTDRTGPQTPCPSPTPTPPPHAPCRRRQGRGNMPFPCRIGPLDFPLALEEGRDPFPFLPPPGRTPCPQPYMGRPPSPDEPPNLVYARCLPARRWV